MADFQVVSSVGSANSYGEDTSLSRGSVLTSGGADTKGSWVELTASSDELTGFIVTAAPNTNGGSTSFMIDIGVGGAGSEVVIVENLYLNSSQAAEEQEGEWVIPIQIAAGERIAARCQSSGVSGTIAALITSESGNFLIGSTGAESISYGEALATTTGVDIDAGASANTKGAWSEITSSSDDLIGFCISVGNNQNSGMVDANFLLDIAIGGAGNEEVIVPNLFIVTSLRESLHYARVFHGIRIPSGTRIAARIQSNITDAADRVLDIVLNGVK